MTCMLFGCAILCNVFEFNWEFFDHLIEFFLSFPSIFYESEMNRLCVAPILQMLYAFDFHEN